MSDAHPMWLRPGPIPGLAGGAVLITGDDPLLDTVRAEARAAGMHLVGPDQPAALVRISIDRASGGAPGTETGFVLTGDGERTVVVAGGASGALCGWFEIVRRAATGRLHEPGTTRHEPAQAVRILDHWDNIDVHPVMGQVERGYAGGSIFFDAGRVRDDLSRVAAYARLLASIGIDRVAINNVNVHAREARLLTDDLADVARIAAEFRPWGIRLHLSVSFASPIVLGGLETSDPLEPAVRAWWREAADRVWAAIPDFGGFVVKADSEGQPGPFADGRDHADGANLLAEAVAPHGGLVHWRAFVYNHTQDWRDRTTDRARAAFDHFTPLDGRFADNVIVQVKHGPMDFQVREPVSPVLAAMPHTRVALELQVTQEYTGQQRHAVYLAPMWREVLDFAPFGAAGPTIADLAAAGGGIAAVSNVGDDGFWTGHPLAQANLYAFGRLAWDATLDPAAILDEWIALTFGSGASGSDGEIAAVVHELLDDSWSTYESYTAPLGVGFMVTPGTHYGPSVDGYEYSPWGTYHFADRDGIGVDRTVATGTGYAGQYPEPWASTYESLDTVPDELLLFFHHVPYSHRLHSGSTVIQHIYDTRFAGVERVDAMVDMWQRLDGRIDGDLFARVRDRLTEQQRSAREWRDHVNTYFLRKSGIADERGRAIHP
ncbi:alpha-glucuronidase [Agromyces intestinalis]|uniref:Alpha-glucuronidase n=1 Tax=Agromyces intestinalis TaxID=2592652 RepID=A0A5C1YFM9_9MICO|nr:alpha-glucuronidase [Agromyces intestinalis]QEO14468.1 alpha-glucuronidase [Agromyces intestinalis]